MQPPKNRYSKNSAVERPKVKAPKPAKLKLPKPQRKEAKRQIQRFTKQSQFGKYFFRSLLAGLVVLVLIVLSTMFTPLLAIDKITVAGNHKVSDKAVLAALKHRLGTPLPMLSESDVAQDLSKFKMIESISLVSKPPHTLEVKIGRAHV